jgi:AraC family transcriptional regulator, transcriptional activator of pobA
MDNAETLEEFYKRKFDQIPDNYRNEIGHFNLFHLEPLIEGKPTVIPYKRRDFYKIMLVKGNSKVHYADRVYEVKKQALSFSNPMIPYKWEHLDKMREGIYCIFSKDFFHQFGQFQQYEVFQPQGIHIFELTDEQAKQVEDIYRRIELEFNSEYKYKYDLIRNLVFELIHFGLKLQPAATVEKQHINASQRIANLFSELLERQFPIEESHTHVQLRTASDFANQLNIHVNHLNKAIKDSKQKTTSQLIGERILQEAKILLKHSSWNVGEIAYSLGFSEVTHFNNFFKKQVKESPTSFRKG